MSAHATKQAQPREGGNNMNDCGLRGLALLDAAIDQIEKHPETWYQPRYRCKSGMCIAGWAAALSGGQWLYPADHDYADYLPAEPDDPDEIVETLFDGARVVDAHDRAVRLIGLDDGFAGGDADRLFAGGNDLADIKRIRDELAAGGLR